MTPANARLDSAAGVTPSEVVAGAHELGLRLTSVQAERLAHFARLLLRWNAVHNLTAVQSAHDVLRLHLLDSLSVLHAIDTICKDRAIALLDVGSGGGLPGIPLAIVRPDWRVTVVDKIHKKVAFLTQAKIELDLVNVTAVHARVEELQGPEYDFIVARAFASLQDFIRVTKHLVGPGGTWLAMKGIRPDAELAILATAFPEVQVIDIVKLNVPRLGAERHLIFLQPS